ncbi:MAG TPA: hypothetical protein VFG19_14265 [Geobacteraceae bacterium]|nr:hypothetical protein [Geobacteraceae bacterium]
MVQKTEQHGTEQINNVVENIRREVSRTRNLKKGFRLARGADVLRHLFPLLAKNGVGVVMDLVGKEVLSAGSPEDNQQITMVLVGVTLHHIASGESISVGSNGRFLGKGRHATRDACLDAVENALRERFLQ